MPLNLALNAALTGLLTAQTALDTISNNLANIDNPNYSRKTVNEAEVTLDGQGAGVEVASITREVDQQLNNNLNDANGGLSQLQTSANYYGQIQNLFGAPGDGSALPAQIQNLYNALETQANDPGQPPAAVVQAASDVTSQLQSMSTSIQGLRTQADQQISTDVGQVNSILQNISTLNNQIALNSATGTDVSDLEDQRDGQLSQLGTYMNFSVFNRPDGTVSIYTPQGTALLDTQALTVAHTASSTLSPQLSYAAGQVQGVTVNGVNITSQITSGQIASLLQMRDTNLPNLQTQLDTLGSQLATGMNQISNAGISWPNGGQSFTGQNSFVLPAQQTITLSGGDTAVALLNSDGSQMAASTVSQIMMQYQQSQNLPVSNTWTISQVANGMNGWFNTQFNTSGITYAQINPQGQLSIQLPQTGGTSLALRDETTSTYLSTISSDPTTALNFTGPLTFSDDGGNVVSVNVTAGDTLNSIAAKLNQQGYVTAQVVASPGGSGSQLQVTDNGGYNLYVDPDTTGSTVVSGLGLLPSGANPATNVTIGFNADNLGTSFTGSEFNANQAQAAGSAISGGGTVPGAGVSGTLVFSDESGPMGPQVAGTNPPVYGFKINSSQSLADIAQQINNSSSGTLTASVVSVGNQVALHVVDASGKQMSVSGISSGGGTNPVTALGLEPPPDQTVQGFSNFFGLNDFFVNAAPVIGYQSQTLTNNFQTNTATSLELSDATWQNGSPTQGGTPGSPAGAPQSLNIDFKAGMSLSAIAAQINQDAVSYDGEHYKPGGFSATGGSLIISSGIATVGQISIAAGTSINDIAAQINGNLQMQQDGVRAIVATDGTEQWLRVYNQEGRPLTFSGSMVGAGGGQLSLTTNQLVNASVIPDGSGQRLQIVNTIDSPLQATGSLVSSVNLASSVAGQAQNLEVRPDIAADPSLIPQGTLQYNAQSNQFYAGEGDNSDTLAMANFLSSPLTMPSAGGLGTGSYTLSQYASNIIGQNSVAASNNNTQLTYQQTLVNNLSSQKGALSGVNLDEELSNMITYQQAYTASARVISTMQQLFDVLNSVIQ